MSSKNNKPANSPGNQDKKPQTPPVSGTATNQSGTTKTDTAASTNDSKKAADNKIADTKATSSSNTTSGQTSKTTATPSSATASASNSKKPLADKPDTASGTNKGGNNKDTTTPPPSRPGTPKPSPLPLIISLIALGLGGYALYNSMQPPPQSGQDEIKELQSQLANMHKTLESKAGNDDIGGIKNDINSIKNDLGTVKQNAQNFDEQIQAIQAGQDAKPAGINEQQVQDLVSKQVGQAKEALQATLQESLAAVQNSQTEEKSTPGLTREQVGTMIKDALASSIQNTEKPAIDFSSEINTIKQDKAEIRQYLDNIKQQGDALKSSLEQATEQATSTLKQTAEQATSTLNQTAEQATSSLKQSIDQAEQQITAADERPIVYPLINSLKLAEIASNTHQYGIASQYLEQAKASFDSLHLNQPPYAEFADQIETLVQQTAQLAKQQDSQQQIDSIIDDVNSWPFINTSPENLLESKTEDKPVTSWQDDIKNIGNNILSSTVTVTKNDAAGLTWVNENPHLQQIIRENVRLDLAMIRNALLTGDQARAQQIVTTLHKEAERYFDTSADIIKQAFATLEQITRQQSDAPDIAALIQSIRKAG